MSPQKITRRHTPPNRVKVMRQPRQTRMPRWIGVSLVLAIVASLSATAGALLAVSLSSTPLLQSELTDEEAEVFNQDDPMLAGNSLRLPRLTRPVNILVLGTKVLTTDVDVVPPELQNAGYHALVNSVDGLSDTMLLVRFNPETDQLVVLSLPRDTRTMVQGRLTKLNEANRLGGPALSAQSVSDLLGGVAIDRYIRINVQGVEKLVDALGGVTVNVPKDMKYQDDSQHLYINLKAGEQTLDGDQALQFLRFRYDENGDIGRIQRQQMLMRSMVEQALTPTTIGRMPKILEVVQSNLDTNLSVEELLALTGFTAKIDRAQVQMLMLPGNFSPPGQYDRSYWLPSPGDIAAMRDRYFGYGLAYAEAVDPAYVRIAIQNSTGSDGAAQSMANILYESGFSNVVSDRALNQSLDVTRIIAQQGDVESAEMIQRFLGIGEVRVESTGDLSSDITIQLGQDWLNAYGAQL